MATKKQKRARGIAKREAFENEQRERGLHFLKLAQDERRAKKAEAKERAIAKSKRLARAHEAAKGSKPNSFKTVGEQVNVSKTANKNRRKKQYNKARNKMQEQEA